MGIPPPSLYATFGSKEDLYKQALDHISERDNKPWGISRRASACVAS
jgi:AcrR family transcriptional regulator